LDFPARSAHFREACVEPVFKMKERRGKPSAPFYIGLPLNHRAPRDHVEFAIEMESLNFKELEHVLVEKVVQLFRDML
jgi:hypothetical protein